MYINDTCIELVIVFLLDGRYWHIDQLLSLEQDGVNHELKSRLPEFWKSSGTIKVRGMGDLPYTTILIGLLWITCSEELD